MNKKIKNATITIYKDITFKSKLEAKVAEYLDLLGIDYKYESFKILLIPKFDYNEEHFKPMVYTPDFTIGNAIIEAKGFPSDAWKVRRKLIMWSLKNTNNLEYFEIHSLNELINMIETDDRFLTYNIAVYDLNDNFVGEYNSLTEAIQELHITSNRGNIISCILGLRNKAGNYKWERVQRVFTPSEGEEWKDVKGFEGLYYVSNLGRVASAQFHGEHNFRLLSQFEDNKGYKFVKLRNWKRNIQGSYSIHRLVAEAFIPNPENKPQVDHIDTNPSNNNLSNLRWVTALENQRNPITLERLRKSIIKLNKEKVGPTALSIKKRKPVLFNDGITTTSYDSITQAAKISGYSTSSIYRWCNKNVHGWSYKYE